MEKRYVRIVSCSNISFWYSGSVGQIFEVLDNDIALTHSYITIINGINHEILFIDCEIIERDSNSDIHEDFPTVSLTTTKESILIEANKIVNGDRNEQYGDAKEAFSVYSEICKSVFGLDLSPDDVCKVLMAVKLGRLKYKYKRDSVVDLCGYAEILSKLNEE